jgi:Tol biopolymer transport system component
MKSILYVIVLILICFQLGYGGWEITSEPVKLVGEDGEIYMNPVWSPTGDLIAYTKFGYRGIWVIKPSNRDIRQLTDDIASGFGFRWSNNGKAIAARTLNYQGRIPFNQVIIFDVENDQSWIVTNDRQRFRGIPHWSTDDQQIYILGRRDINIFESGLKGSEQNSSPIKKQRIYLQSGKIIVEDPDDASKTIQEPIRGREYINLESSPDGNKIVFEVFGGNMFVMNTDGTGLIDLGIGYRPKWSPDSEYLVYMITEDDGHRYISSDIYTIKIDGSEKTNLTNTTDVLEMNPSWSPNGNHIAFDTYAEGDIYIVEINNL